jgi:hypothetical protein
LLRSTPRKKGSGISFGFLLARERADLRRDRLLLVIVNLLVMPALVAGIHVLGTYQHIKDVDGRDKPGHDEIIQ